MGLTALSITKAAVPVGDDTVIHSRLSEIHIPKQGKLDFDSDIVRLSNMEGQFQEKLPSLSEHPRLKGPMQRVAHQKYRYSGKQSSVSKR